MTITKADVLRALRRAKGKPLTASTITRMMDGVRINSHAVADTMNHLREMRMWGRVDCKVDTNGSLLWSLPHIHGADNDGSGPHQSGVEKEPETHDNRGDRTARADDTTVNESTSARDE